MDEENGTPAEGAVVWSNIHIVLVGFITGNKSSRLSGLDLGNEHIPDGTAQLFIKNMSLKSLTLNCPSSEVVQGKIWSRNFKIRLCSLAALPFWVGKCGACLIMFRPTSGFFLATLHKQVRHGTSTYLADQETDHFVSPKWNGEALIKMFMVPTCSLLKPVVLQLIWRSFLAYQFRRPTLSVHVIG